MFTNYHRIAVVQESENEYESAIKMYGLSLRVLQDLHQHRQLQPDRQALIGIVEAAIKTCQRSSIALGDWETLLQQPPALVPELLNIRGQRCLELGWTDDAVEAVAKLRELKTATGGQLYNAACIYSRCAASIKADEKELTTAQSAARQKHVAGALATLREAIAAGFDKFDHLKNDPQLAPVRNLPEFQKLLPAE